MALKDLGLRFGFINLGANVYGFSLPLKNH